MSTYGEDSLNEHTEDEGLVLPGGESQGLAGDEPTREQLIATGELDEDETEEVEEVAESEEPGAETKPDTPPGTAVAIKEEEEVGLSIRKEVEKRLMAGATRNELIDEGFNKNTVRTVASEVKSKLHTNKAVGKPTVARGEGIPVTAKGVPPEVIIENIEVPDISNGSGFVFEQGMKFGMSVVTLGIRMAQELSGIGVMQAKPLLDMAKSMREGESLAAKNAAGEAAMEAAGLVRESIMPILTNLSQATPPGTDPMKAMMVRAMEPIVTKMMGGMIGGLLPGGVQQPQLPPGQPTEGWIHRTEEKPKEE